MKKIRVLVVDDSVLMHQLITEILGQDRELEVVGTAKDPFNARENPCPESRRADTRRRNAKNGWALFFGEVDGRSPYAGDYALIID